MSDLKAINIFEMQSGSDPVQATIVSSIQELLKADMEFMAIRSRIMRTYTAYGTNPENMSFPGPENTYQEGAVVIGVEPRDLEAAKNIFCAYAEMLGIDSDFTAEYATDLDLVSAAVALELWSSVFYMDIWQGAIKCAGIQGPDAVNSLSAIIARGFGHGIPCMPFDPDLPNLNFQSKLFFNTIRLSSDFVRCILGSTAWPKVVYNVVNDLGYSALGGSRTHNAALLAGLCMLQMN